MKTIIIAASLFFSVNALGATLDTLSHKPTPEVPVRYNLDNGTGIPDNLINAVHRKDCSDDGWKFDLWEWLKLERGFILKPSHYIDPIHGDNGGISTT